MEIVFAGKGEKPVVDPFPVKRAPKESKVGQKAISRPQSAVSMLKTGKQSSATYRPETAPQPGDKPQYDSATHQPLLRNRADRNRWREQQYQNKVLVDCALCLI